MSRTSFATLLTLACLASACTVLDGVDAEGHGGGLLPDGEVAALESEPCSRRELGEDREVRYLTAQRVMGGELAGTCLGVDEPVLETIWSTLATIAPVELREDLGVFALFESDERGDDVTLAFVATLDDEGTAFQMAFNADEADTDSDELLLTIAHEFSHVFTATTDQLDRVIQPQDCTTYDNGEGCYLPGSLMLGWIDAFWPAGELADVDQSGEPTVADGDARCADDDGFFGPYGATTPEEDFGEAFSAFVMDVPPLTETQAERLVWFEDHPDLVEVRDRARAAGIGPLEHSFEACGRG